MKLQNFTCPNCGKSLEANPSLDIIMCNACGTSFTPDMDTAKLAIHKISGIVNKAMDNHQENKRLKAELMMEQQKDSWKTLVAGVLLLLMISVVCFLMAAVL